MGNMMEHSMNSLINDEFSSTITLALREMMKQFEGKDDERSKIMYRCLQGSEAVFNNLYIAGIELFGKTYERFLEELKEKRNVVFLSDDEIKKYNRARKIMEFMEEECEKDFMTSWRNVYE